MMLDATIHATTTAITHQSLPLLLGPISPVLDFPTSVFPGGPEWRKRHQEMLEACGKWPYELKLMPPIGRPDLLFFWACEIKKTIPDPIQPVTLFFVSFCLFFLGGERKWKFPRGFVRIHMDSTFGLCDNHPWGVEPEEAEAEVQEASHETDMA